VPERARAVVYRVRGLAAVLVPAVIASASKLFALTGVSTTEAAADGAPEEEARPAGGVAAEGLWRWVRAQPATPAAARTSTITTVMMAAAEERGAARPAVGGGCCAEPCRLAWPAGTRRLRGPGTTW